MLITRVRLQNFCLHKELDIELRPGINGIVGSNGSGKSTILDAIRIGITGETISYGTKADNISWGERSAKITLNFRHGDTDYEIERRIGKPSSQKLVTPEFTYTKQGEISKFIEQLTGTTTEAMLNNVFVAQGAIDNILYSTSTQRLKEIQQTVGLSRASEAEKAIAAEMARYNVTIGLDEQIVSAEETLEAAKAELGTVNRRLQELEDEITSLRPYEETLHKMREAQLHYTAFKSADEELNSAAAALEAAKESLDKATSTRDSIMHQLESIEADAKNAVSELAEYDADKRQAQSAAENLKRLAEVKEALGNLSVTPEDRITEWRETLEKRKSTLSVRRQMIAGTVQRPQLKGEQETLDKLASTESALKELGSSRKPLPDEESLSHRITDLAEQVQVLATGECPTCGQDILEETFTLTRGKLSSAETELAQLRDTREAEYVTSKGNLQETQDILRKEVDQFNIAATKVLKDTVAKLEQGVQELTGELDSAVDNNRLHNELIKEQELLVKHTGTVSDMDQWTDERLDNLRKLVENSQLLSDNLQKFEVTVQLKRQSVESCEQSVEAAQERKRRLTADAECPSDEEIKKAQKEVEKLFARTQSRRDLLDQQAPLEVKCSQYTDVLTRLRAQQRAEEADAAWVKVCKKVREALHVKGLPSLLMREYAALLNRRMRYYLSFWEAPFQVYLDEDLSFTAEFPDGRIHSAARLSGGQKIVASTSFRLAMADTFAKQVALLQLDEPSNCLDEDNINHLQHLLQKLKELAGASGKQILLVTHEESLKGFFDHTIMLDGNQ